ncbi:hypothetical protein, partial [Helicobacter bilis]|uniref:hypothetical protein n=1 Tax=Helicobacter bilis TaxID=37372 RepID=UPI001B326593
CLRIRTSEALAHTCKYDKVDCSLMFYKEYHYRESHGNLYFHYVKLCYYCITIKLNIIISLF